MPPFEVGSHPARRQLVRKLDEDMTLSGLVEVATLDWNGETDLLV